MAKKTAKKKTTKKSAKKTASKSSARKASTTKKTPSKKTASKTTASKKTAKKVAKKVAKKTSKKSTTKKPAAKKTASKKTAAKKTAAKKTTTKKPTTKTASKKAASKTPSAKKTVSKKTVTKKPAPKKTAKSSPSKPAPAKTAPKGAKATEADASKAGNRKGITIVKPTKKTGSRSRNTPKFVMPERPMLLGPGSKFSKTPLIPSGPSAPKQTSVLDAPKSRRKKSPLTKAKLDKYRALLIAKRAELLGDVVSMENEALRSGSGASSHTPNHLAEQGSENYDQTLSLNLAAQDRRLIKDIDDALKRIEDGTYGLCELTGQPIPEARLNELPWARYTIEAARELERRGPSA